MISCLTRITEKQLYMIVIHHNLACGTSQHALNTIKATSYRPEVSEYFELRMDKTTATLAICSSKDIYYIS